MILILFGGFDEYISFRQQFELPIEFKEESLKWSKGALSNPRNTMLISMKNGFDKHFYFSKKFLSFAENYSSFSRTIELVLIFLQNIKI